MATTDKKITLTFEVSGNGATMLKQIDGEIKKFSLSTKQAEAAAKNFGTTVQGLSNVSVKQSSLEFQKLSGSMGGFSDSTGIASAGALELGRVISDLPYGIRGVANNLSQLSSNILFAATKIDKATGVAIGFSGAIKGIWKSLMGPLGLLLAIQGVIAAFDFFSNRQEKAKDDVDKLNVSIDKQVNKLGILQEMLSQEISSGSFGSKEFNEQLEVLVDKFSEFGLKYKSLTDEQKKDSSFLRNLIEGYQLLLVTRNRIKKVEKEIGDIQVGNTKEQYEGQLEALKNEALMLMSQELRLKKAFEVEKNKNKRTEKQYKEHLLDLSKEIDSFNKRQEEALVESETKLNEIKRKYEKEELEGQYDLFVEKEKLRLKNYIATTENEDLIAKAKRLSHEVLRDAEVEYDEAIKDLNFAQNEESLRNIRDFNKQKEDLARENKQTLEDIEFAEESQERIGKGFTTGARGEGVLEAGKLSEEGIQLQMESNLKIQLIEAELASKVHSAEREAELELEREVMRKKSLQGAEMSSKAKIKLDKLELESKKQSLSDLGSLLNSASQIANRNSAEGKALAVASATISTYASAQAAYESQIIPGDPSSVPRAILAAASSVISGIARVKQILSVKVPGDKGGSAPSGGGNQSREFDFNLVGSTGINQLAEGVAGQFGQPIQAYVVSSQISSQQQLDGVIQSNATIGD